MTNKKGKFRMGRMFCVIASLFLACAGPVMAGGTSPVVVELFTSQGCSSCPPADEMLRKLVKRKDVIPLALHVDYWDYIGWKDKFADPAFTERQRSYARVAGKRSIYTPQMVIGGVEHVVGTRPMELAEYIQSHSGKVSPVTIALERQGSKVLVRAQSDKVFRRDLILQIVRYSPEQSVSIKRGENAGRTISYVNIVTAWQPVARWDGKKPLAVKVDASGSDPLVAILQEQGPGAILAAAQLR
ncbi:DUF1223 domain-containing protein [Actibacterium lipolyticum]|uniref:DUF1223 domain-containing protein n=1 Tax=Actibacterium lipolyticum TaxID=1524263 RepID=A0A238KHQ2_9RHOB|nr:DUF1223 domain-containing protein [Actibacterium lipolyticum]SMX42228.1 hypothetical protein COL8621_01917 [Actibacterium lipolyticum]